MRKIKYIDAFCLLYCIVAVFFFIFIGLLQDKYLFKSDPVNFFIFTLALSFIVFLPFLSLAILLKDFARPLAVILATSVLFGFVVFLSFPFLDKINRFDHLLTLLASVYINCFFIIRIANNKVGIVPSVVHISRVLTGAAIVGFVMLWGYQRYIMGRSGGSSTGRKNVVVIVVDGMSTEFLKAYSDRGDDSDFEKIASESILYKNMRTNFASTSGFFKTFYSGRKDGRGEKENLLSVLQKHSINTRWSTFHNGGVPDAQKLQYRGLRSAFVNQGFNNLPYLLGADYNVFRYCNLSTQYWWPVGWRSIGLYRFINRKICDTRNMIIPHIVEETRRLREARRPFLFVCHLAPPLEIERKGIFMHIAWAKAGIKSGIRKTIEITIKKEQEYTYTAAEEKIAGMLRQLYREDVHNAAKSLKQLYGIFKEKGWDKDTVLIFTADHGEVFAKGKAYYGYHNEEEVARVPLMIHYGDRRGVDERMAETIDLTQTILDCFSIDEKFSENAQSLLAKREKEKTVTTLTTASKLRKEEFLNVYKDGYKYVFNIHPKGNGSAQKCRISGFDTVPIEEGEGVKKALGLDLGAILSEYGLKRDFLK